MSFVHCPGLRTEPSCCPSFVLSPKSGWKPTWMWSAWSGSARVLSAPSKVMRLMIWWGFIVPWRVSSRRIGCP